MLISQLQESIYILITKVIYNIEINKWEKTAIHILHKGNIYYIILMDIAYIFKETTIICHIDDEVLFRI